MDIGALQPFGWLEFEPLFAKEYLEKIELVIQKTKEQHISIKELASLWPTTAGIRCQLLFLFCILKAARIERQRRKALCDFFFAMLQERAVSDVYGETSNICQTKEEINALFTRLSLKKGTPEMAKLLGKISNAGYNFIAGLYFDIYLDYAMENEGPYDMSEIYGQKHILVIKKYIGLQSEVWPEVKSPINDLMLYCVYKDVTFSCDMASCHSLYKGDVINNLVTYAVVADGKVITDFEKLKKILDSLSMLSVEQWQRLKSLDIEKQKQKGLLSKCYGMKRVFHGVGIDWHPTKAMKEAVKGKPLKDNSYWQMPKENQKEYWNKIYDPRIDFYPTGSTL